MTVEAVPVEDGERKKGKKVVPIKEVQTPASTAETPSLAALAERILLDSTVSIERANQVLDFLQRADAERRRTEADVAKREFVAAFVAAQGEMAPVAKDAANPQTKSKYASYDAIDRALRPIYTKHGFTMSFDVGEGAPVDHVRVMCFVGHKGGHERVYHLDMPADGKGAKGGDVMTKTHAMGSALTYGKRYLYGNVWNIAPTEKDDDGNAAGAREGLNREQVDTLFNLIAETNSNLDIFLQVAKVAPFDELDERSIDAVKAKLGSISAKDYPRLVGLLEKKKNRSKV